MKTSIITLVLLVCVACTDNVGVVDSGNHAGGAGVEAARLQSSLLPKCRSICQVVSTCPGVASSACDCTSADTGSAGATSTTADCTCTSSNSNFDDCFGSCLSEFGTAFLNHGEVCAAAGMAVLECFAGFDCAAFTQARTTNDHCGLEQAQTLCPAQDDTATPQDSSSSIGSPPSAAVGGSGQSVADRSAAVGGAGQSVADRSAAVGGAGGATSITGSNTGVAGTSSVICSAFGANDGEFEDTSPDGWGELCETSAARCSDSHTYRLSCSSSLQDSVDCYCIVDGLLHRTFQDPVLLQHPSVAACNNPDAANARCGWSLTFTEDAADAP